MGLTVRDNGCGDFELIPEATYIATSYLIVDLGTHEYEYMGNAGQKQQVYIGWELNDTDSQGRPFTTGKYYTASLGKKANLRKDLEAWRGRAFTDSELEGFHLHNIMGKSCSIGIIHKEAGEYKKARVSSIQALPKGTAAYQPANKPIIFDLDDFNSEVFATFPDFLKNTIKESAEYKAMVAAGFIAPDQDAPADNGFSTDELLTEDDIPF